MTQFKYLIRIKKISNSKKITINKINKIKY